ncbi:hypothetical protein RND71_000890 [Anisodus tanguticus]|uniref:Uncharacterized protein n=1 Tax=Anisodus tanguticus TaxID=243964 RepID=A0AAE1VQF6_9SOLA|nr:hypothetical protein RND71_000890 [Anisodus tanguticus]
MGMILGKISVETFKYESIQSTVDYEIRNCAAAVVAQVTYDSTPFKGNKNGGFIVLANYIGELDNLQNAKPEKMDINVHVITKSAYKIAVVIRIEAIVQDAAVQDFILTIDVLTLRSYVG